MDKLVIPADTNWKNMFDAILILSSVYNVIINAYYAAFRSPSKNYEMFFDQAIEVLFFFDMIFCFF